MAKVLLVSPFHGGSHQDWAAGLFKYSKHDWQLLSLPAESWKWRMQASSLELAQQLKNLNSKFDLLLATDMLDLPSFLGFARKAIGDIPTGVYFHENQLSYPWSPKERHRDDRRKFYAYMNFKSAVAADYCIFNSHYNQNSFLDGLQSFLTEFPNNKDSRYIDKVRKQSRVIYPGLELPMLAGGVHKDVKLIRPLILWNHRWEYDKNPKDFFKLLRNLKATGYNFSLCVLGESGHEKLEEFRTAKKEFLEQTLHWGYVEDREQYWHWLREADILPVTSKHEFFGISVLEAVYAGTIPILPKRLSYPEIFKDVASQSVFYRNFNELEDKIKALIDNKLVICSDNLGKTSRELAWSQQVASYDDWITEIV